MINKLLIIEFGDGFSCFRIRNDQFERCKIRGEEIFKGNLKEFIDRIRTILEISVKTEVDVCYLTKSALTDENYLFKIPERSTWVKSEIISICDKLFPGYAVRFLLSEGREYKYTPRNAHQAYFYDYYFKGNDVFGVSENHVNADTEKKVLNTDESSEKGDSTDQEDIIDVKDPQDDQTQKDDETLDGNVLKDADAEESPFVYFFNLNKSN